MTLTGSLLIGARDAGTDKRFEAVNPATGTRLGPAFADAGPGEVEAATRLAAAAARPFRETTPAARAAFLDAVAAEIEAVGDALIDRAAEETGLPKARLTGERARTIGQLRLFGTVVRDGAWLDARIDPALPDRKPLPRPDLRMRQVAVGPVAVFGASNFPLAFSVAGGDTASALAAGCPVVVKGHPAHPGTSELVGRAVRRAVAAAGLPEGVFSLLSGITNELGGALVSDPRIMSVGFTGSRAGGLALMRIAAGRPVPIPVHAEMSSVNPVFLLPAALEARAEALGQSFVASLVLGAGQFCTNPGLVIGVAGPAMDRFTEAACTAVESAAATTMLTAGIHQAYGRSVEALRGYGAELLSHGLVGEGPNTCRAALFATDGDTFLVRHALAEEVFGAASLIVRCRDAAQMRAIAEGLEGQLTATLQLEAADHVLARDLLPVLEERAGRVLANGWPTGVEVSYAMVHGGPFPATSDPRTTSVGTLAIRRFLRPVSYQDFADDLLPDALKQANPDNIPRWIDGKLL